MGDFLEELLTVSGSKWDRNLLLSTSIHVTIFFFKSFGFGPETLRELCAQGLPKDSI